ncbi:MAG: penicillin-binding protein 2 [Candidatus Pacebacteria bacterium]|nr:penicillin-binding protein 2 [Candidatus Paceibacterota bacterium]
MKIHSLSRIRIISIALFLFAVLIVAKLYLVQVVDGHLYTDKADRQYVKPNENLFDRGSIFFQTRSGDLVSAATLKTGYLVSLSPKLVTDPETTFEKMDSVIPLEKESFLEKAGKKADPYEEVARKVSEADATKIESLKLPGVSVYKEKWRYYPGMTMAANVLGFVGSDGKSVAGQYGLEKYYEAELNRNDTKLNVNFFAEIFSDVSKTLVDDKQAEGDIVSTIEPSVQLFLEKQLKSLQAEWNPDTSGAIIIDPKTGEIYAMAALPTFDPNNFNLEKNPRVFTNPLVDSVYEMGSIIKPLTMAAGIDSGTVTPTTTYDDKGFLELNGSKISNFDFRGRGVVPMQEVLNQSLNTGAATVALRMGKDLFSKYMLNYGLGEETGIDLPNEAAGLVENLKSPRDIEHATAAYGQGIALTPIATVRALSSLGNGGTLPDPHVVKTLKYNVGLSKDLFTGGGEKQVLKKETSETITKMLVEVVDKALRHGTVKLKNWSVAAKTGTAQMANPAGKGYYADRYLHSFFGYFPAYNPKFLVFMYMVYPKGANYASETLTTSFFDITKFLINYYEIPPDR